MSRLPPPVPALPATDPERVLALSYAPRDRRAALAALLALDETLAAILRTTREPLVGQMRLTWWFDALTALDTAPPPAQPVLRALANEVLPLGVAGPALAAMVEGWEGLLDPDPLADERLDAYAQARGGLLFALAGGVLGADRRDPLAAAGVGWALGDLARHVRDAATASRARVTAAGLLDHARSLRWSRPARALGALAHIARMDLAEAPSPPGSPRRVARLAWHRLSGR